MRIFDDPDQLARGAAELVAAELRAGARTLVLAGGSTPERTYRELARAELAWGRVTVLFGDERCVGPFSSDSNYRMAGDALLHHVAPLSVHRIPGELGAEAAADLYEAIVRTIGSLDLVLLGLGPDGHTASLFPGQDTLASERLVEPVHNSPKPPPDRVTLTLRALRAARRVIFLAAGGDKAEAVARAQRAEVPAGLIPSAEWLLDRAAAAQLEAGAA